MLIVQQNYDKVYKYTVSAFKVSLGLKALVICNQKPFLRNQNFVYVGFNLYWHSETNNQKNM